MSLTNEFLNLWLRRLSIDTDTLIPLKQEMHSGALQNQMVEAGVAVILMMMMMATAINNTFVLPFDFIQQNIFYSVSKSRTQFWQDTVLNCIKLPFPTVSSPVWQHMLQMNSLINYRLLKVATQFFKSYICSHLNKIQRQTPTLW